MLLCKIGKVAQNIARRLADDFQVPNHCILFFFIREKLRFSHMHKIPVYAGNRLKNMLQVILQRCYIAPTHNT